MTRTVRDAAILLGVLAGSDPKDPATANSDKNRSLDYTRFLDPTGLRGARIGVARQLFQNRNERARKVIENALQLLKDSGAELIDPVNLPSHGKFGSEEFEVLLYEFKDGLNKYLAGLGEKARIKSLAELIEFNSSHSEQELLHFGQETLLQAEGKGPLTDKTYLEALDKCRQLSRTEGIDAVMDQQRLDAIVAPSGGPAHLTDLLYGDRSTGGSSTYPAVAGYPNITVPAGQVAGLPLGLSFFGRAWSEPALLKFAYHFELSTRARRAPTFAPTMPTREV